MAFDLCLFDLDHTLLPIDSDHAWGEFMIRIGWVDGDEFKRRNDAFYADYQAGRLDLAAYIAFSTQPLRKHLLADREAAHRRFMREVIEPNLRPAALALVSLHRERGDSLVLITATNDFVTAPIASRLGIAELIAVRLQQGPGGTITGRIDGVPSYREGKVVRVTQWLAGQGVGWGDIGRLSVYSDSVNDLPLLERATEPVATNPSAELEAVARHRGWRILNLFQ